MRKFLSLLLVVCWGLFVVSSAGAWSTSYSNVSADFVLTGFSDGNAPPAGTEGPDTLTLRNISNLTLPNPDPGLYEWFLDLEYLYLDLTNILPGNEVEIGSVSDIPLGTWEAPLSATGTTVLPDTYIPERTVTLGGNTLTIGGFTLSGVTFGWELYRDETSTELAEPGDSILTAVLTLSGGNLQTLNSQLAALEYAWESSQNGPSNLNYIDGSLETSFTLRADPVPEPATGLLVLAGLPLLYWVRRKVKS